MRIYFLLLIGMGIVHFSFGQDSSDGGERTRFDSLIALHQARMKAYMHQQEIYRYMFERDPKRAMDSVVIARIDEAKEGALVRMKSYEANLRIDTLKKIDLSYCGLSEIPSFVYRAKMLGFLDISYNFIKRLPKQLGDLPHLKSINWDANHLEDRWWIGISRLDSIHYLSLKYNTLTRIPWAIRRLKSLNTLSVNENLFESFPINRLAAVSSLKNIQMSKCPLLKIRDDKYDQLDSVESLTMHNCSLEGISPTFYEIKNLKYLYLQENEIGTLPNGISGLENLVKLSVYKNKLESLPEDIGELKQLTDIDLYYNELDVLPESIGQLENLKLLYASNNQLYDVPESIGNLRQLQALYLHHNRLSVLPESIRNLDSLKTIRVNNNYLVDFPQQILGLSGLQDIDISDNEITVIPVAIRNLGSLELFTYHDNPVNFESDENAQLLNTLYQMARRGVVCVPSVEIEVRN